MSDRRLAVVLALVSLVPSLLVAQEQPPGSRPVFKTRAEAVNVDVLVTKDGEPLRGLTAANFEVKDQGVVRFIGAPSTQSVQHVRGMRWRTGPASLRLSAGPVNVAWEAQPPTDVEMTACALRQDRPCYNAIVDAYAAGYRRLAVDTILHFDIKHLKVLTRFCDSSQDPKEPWDAKRYAAAAMLHTDAASQVSSKFEGNVASAHTTIAALLLQAGAGLSERPDRFGSRVVAVQRTVKRFAEAWYRALSRYLVDRNAPMVAHGLLGLGRELLIDDPVVLAESGILAESLATTFAMLSKSPREKSIRPTLMRRSALLEDAVKWLRRATALEPDNDLWQLHLGRALALRLDDSGALGILSTLAGRAKDPTTAYLAWMFIGGIEERRGHVDDAIAAYRTAMESRPTSQSSYVALSHLLQRVGRGEESRQVLQRLLLDGDDRAESDPVLDYRLDPPEVVEARLDTLREEARR